MSFVVILCNFISQINLLCPDRQMKVKNFRVNKFFIYWIFASGRSKARMVGITEGELSSNRYVFFIRPKESIMLSDRFMLFSPIELKFFSGLFRPS